MTRRQTAFAALGSEVLLLLVGWGLLRLLTGVVRRPPDGAPVAGARQAPDWAQAFWADGGRLAADPVLSAQSGGLFRFVGSGRYVLTGWTDRGPFRVEVDLPAPGGIDVVLR
jgi:hypothetical protein